MMQSLVSIPGIRLLLILGLLLCFIVGPGPVRLAEAQADELFEITLEELGYGNRALRGPWDQTYYYFGLPAHWEPQEGGYLALNLDYNVTGQEGHAPALVEVRLNNEVLYTEELETLGAFQVQVDIPPEILFPFESRYLNELQLDLLVYAECERASLTSLVVRASSSLHLAYSERPLPIDLALYPEPLYQPRSFEPNVARFVLPTEPSDTDVEVAAMIASRLGKLAGSSLTISATLASDAQIVSGLDEHLIIIGQPESSPLLARLDLPLPLAERRLVLRSEMPATVAPGEVFSYTLSVENTERKSQTVFVEDRLPAAATWLSCSGECRQGEAGVLRWQISDLPADGEASTLVQLRLDEQMSLDERVEHTATLFDDEGNAINVDTLAATVSTASSEQVVASASEKGSYFFVQADRGVAEDDGLVQELVSPWSSRHVVVVVTGLSEEALLKAAQALSSETRFPGMTGAYALVRDVKPPSSETAPVVEDMSFDSLGYRDAVLRGPLSGDLEYAFDLPWGWSLTDEAYVALHLAHGMAVEDMVPTLEIQLNGVPISSVLLLEENAADAWLTVPLPESPLTIGPNKLGLRMAYDVDWCVDIRDEQAWLTIHADSFFHLPRESEPLALDLANFPQPFSSQSDLRDVVFVLPARPTLAQIEGTLHLAAALGRAAGGDDFAPRVALRGDPAAEQWPGYNLIVLGRPTTNPYIATVNDVLPQPFYPGTDELQQEVDKVIYRLEPGTSLGFVQELFAPWDDRQAMLIATGTTEAGVVWAMSALTDSDLSWRLSGNLALVREREVRAMDTRERAAEDVAKVVATLVPELTSEATATPTPTMLPSVTPTLTMLPPATPTLTATPTATAVTSTRPARPVWLFPLLIASVLIVIGAVAVAIWQSRA